MQTEKPNQAAIAIKWALFNFIAAIIITIGTQLIGIDPFGFAKYIGDISLILFICLAQVEYRQQLAGYLTYGEGFTEGLLCSVFSGILIAIFMFAYTDLINPQAWSSHLDAEQADLVKAGITGDQLDNAMAIMRRLGIFAPIAGALVGVPIIGIIISLITAAIFKKERTVQDIERQQNDPAI